MKAESSVEIRGLAGEWLSGWVDYTEYLLSDMRISARGIKARKAAVQVNLC
jgi:hypothetical protein